MKLRVEEKHRSGWLRATPAEFGDHKLLVAATHTFLKCPEISFKQCSEVQLQVQASDVWIDLLWGVSRTDIIKAQKDVQWGLWQEKLNDRPASRLDRKSGKSMQVVMS